MRIGYDEECGSVVIVGRDVFPACALRATMDASGKIRVMSLAETAELYTDWFRIETLDGRTFGTPEDAKAYVDGILMRRPEKMVITPYAITNAASYAVNHGLTYTPRATVVSADGAEVDTDVSHAPGQTVLTFASPFTGTLYLG
jgi:hypothetical protein